MKTACCIVAAGQGSRLGEEWAGTPKALVPILGRAMLYYSLHAFDNAGPIDRFVIAAPEDSVKVFREQARIWGFSRPSEVVAGGETRAQSVLNALRELKADPPDIVLIHDCARPCLTSEMISALFQASSGGKACVLGHPTVDTLREVEGDRIVLEIDRSAVAALETPQLFPYQRILELHEQSQGDEELPDDTTLFTRAGEYVKLVYHEGSNIKVTYPEDIAAAEGILFQRGWQDAGEGEE